MSVVGALLVLAACTVSALTLGVIIGKGIARADEIDRRARLAAMRRHASAPVVAVPDYVPGGWL